jgi:hypothetical protein
MSIQREWDDFMAVGVGYDAVSGKIRGDGVQRTPVEGEGGEEVVFAINAVSSRKELARFMNITASASMRYAMFSGAGKTKYFETLSINQYSIYIVVACVVSHSAKRMRDVVLKDSARQLLASGNSEQFRTTYGDEFVVGYTSGGEFYGIYELATKSEDEHKKFSQDLQGAGGYGAWSGSGSVAFEIAIQKLSEVLNMTFQMHISGGESNAPLAITAAELIEFARRFPQTVRGPVAKKHSALFLGYDTLDLPAGPNLIDIAAKRDVLEKLGEKRIRHLDMMAAIDYIIYYHEQFEPFDAQKLRDSWEDLRSDINTMKSSASACAEDYKKCELPTLKNPVVNLPARLNSNAISAVRLAQEAAKRAEQNGQACNQHVKKIVEISREIILGPKGKTLADTAKIELESARQCAFLCQRALADAKTSDTVLSAEIDLAIAQAAAWVQRARQDVVDAEGTFDKEIYPIGYSPYWNAPDVIYHRPYRVEGQWFQPGLGLDVRSKGYKQVWGGQELDSSQARKQGQYWGTVDEYTTDPSGGDVILRPADKPNTSSSPQWVRHTIENQPATFKVNSSPSATPWQGRFSVLEAVFGGDEGRRQFCLVRTNGTGSLHESEWLFLDDWEGREMTLPFVLVSSVTGLQTKVELKIVIVNSQNKYDSYIENMNITRTRIDPPSVSVIRADSEVFGKPLGWRSKVVIPR